MNKYEDESILVVVRGGVAEAVSFQDTKCEVLIVDYDELEEHIGIKEETEYVLDKCETLNIHGQVEEAMDIIKRHFKYVEKNYAS